MDLPERNFYIELYHTEYGMTQREIVETLSTIHSHHISERQVRRILASMGLNRRKLYSPIEDVLSFIQESLYGSTSRIGYRLMYYKCKQAGLRIPQEAVRLILRHLDPDGVAFRISRRLIRRRYYARGPNYIWHLDGYDKLTPYGLCISACIDGFSRRIIWAEVYKTNKDPEIIAGYFIDAVKEINGCPTILRMDAGSENVTCFRLQQYFRERDGIVQGQCCIVGKSTSNQRIESWWAIFRRGCAEFWISMLHNLLLSGQFSGDEVDKELVRFCFVRILQVRKTIMNELSATQYIFNHTILTTRTIAVSSHYIKTIQSNQHQCLLCYRAFHDVWRWLDTLWTCVYICLLAHYAISFILLCIFGWKHCTCEKLVCYNLPSVCLR